ncbi:MULTISPECIES: cupin domain-containing protein [Pseudomonas]|uniref:cupin domain-containing protein n=1 Tax=Pseudomonas TaxID=286 RepID=UPI00398FF342
MYVRRIVTGIDSDGKSILVSDGSAPRTRDFEHIPGFSNTVVWATESAQAPTGKPEDPTPTLTAFTAPAGGSRLFVVQIPPASVFAGLDFAAADAEQNEHLPGLAETFDPERPGFHRTQSVDYMVLLQGELWLELDKGPAVQVRPGHIVVQNGTYHAWTNKSDQPAVFMACSMGTSA